MKKAIKLTVLLMVLFLAVIGCDGNGNTQTGGEDRGGVAFVGVMEEFTDINDGGSSTVYMEEITEEGKPGWRFTGTVTDMFQYGFVGWEYKPDAETLAALKDAKSISFRTKGDGLQYTVKYRISGINDHAYHEYNFTAGAQASTITVDIWEFSQPSWTETIVPMDQSNVEDISWQTYESWRPGNFDITIWDVRVSGE